MTEELAQEILSSLNQLNNIATAMCVLILIFGIIITIILIFNKD